MSILDDTLNKLSEKNLSNSEIEKLMCHIKDYASQNTENKEIAEKISYIITTALSKMNTQELEAVSPEISAPKQTQADTKETPMKVEDIFQELTDMQKKENNPEEYLKKCQEILKDPKDTTLAEMAIYGLGKMVEKYPETAHQATQIIVNTDLKKLSELDNRYGKIIGTALADTAQKINQTDDKLDGPIVKIVADRYTQRKGDELFEANFNANYNMDNPSAVFATIKECNDLTNNPIEAQEVAGLYAGIIRQECTKNDPASEKNTSRALVELSNFAERSPECAKLCKSTLAYVAENNMHVSEQVDAAAGKLGYTIKTKSPEDAEFVNKCTKTYLDNKLQNWLEEKGTTINEEKLPQLRLAGKEGTTFDLNKIADELKALKPGEKIALGRSPEAMGIQGKTVTVGENNNYVSRHHCDIVRTEKGELKLVDRSLNGTEILPPQASKTRSYDTENNKISSQSLIQMKTQQSR